MQCTATPRLAAQALKETKSGLIAEPKVEEVFDSERKVLNSEHSEPSALQGLKSINKS